MSTECAHINVITKKASPGKYPEQSRASLHLTDESHVKSFEAAFLAITFHDAKGTYKDQNLKGLPPTLGFAPIQRIPAGKPRVDGRQGTIDQDPEYMAFLESETQPVPKPTALDATNTEKTKETITTTPLIEALREKKANKEKAKAAKSAKRDDSKDDKVEKSGGRKGTRGAEVKPKAKTEIVARDAPKPVKQATKAAANGSAATSDTNSPTASPAPNRKRERAPANIKSMLQRDLGLSEPTRRGGKQNATNSAVAPPGTATTTPASAVEPPQNVQNGSGRNGRGKKNRDAQATEAANTQAGQSIPVQNATPVAASGRAPAQQNQPRAPKAKAEANSTTAVSANQTPKPQAAKASNPRPPKSAPQPSPGSTRAYLKHANASQGITEPLLKAALSTFGEVTALDIDKRKGTALATFKDHESFKAAMAKRSIPVAQGAVEVLEFREKPTPPANKGTPAARGGGAAAGGGGGGGGGRGRGRGRGGGAAAPDANSPAVAAPAPTAPAPVAAPPTTGDAT